MITHIVAKTNVSTPSSLGIWIVGAIIAVIIGVALAYAHNNAEKKGHLPKMPKIRSLLTTKRG